MPPLREPLLIPFDVRLLGRLVANPDRPFDDYIDMVDVGIDVGTDVESGRFNTLLEGPIHEIISVWESDSHPDSPTTEGTTVTATGSTTYYLPFRWPWDFRECIDDAFEKAAVHLGGSYYVVTALRTIDGYSITPTPAAGYALGTRQTELDSSGVTPPLPTGEIVIAIKFQGVTVVYRNGTSYATLANENFDTCFLDWSRGPSEPSATKTTVETGSRRTRYHCEFVETSGWGRDEGELMWSIASGRMEPPPVQSKGNIGKKSAATIKRAQQDATFRSEENYPLLYALHYFVPNPNSKKKRLQSSAIFTERKIFPRPATPTVQYQQTTQFLVSTVPTDYAWPIRFSRGKTKIMFPFQCRQTAANTVKAWIEDVVREPINWWPLSPRRHQLPEGCVWIEWQCRCGRILSTTISTERRTQYYQWIIAGANSSTTLTQPIPMTTLAAASVPSSNSPNMLPAANMLPAVPPQGTLVTTLNPPSTPHTAGGAKTTQNKILMWCINLSTRLTVVTNLMVPLTDEDIFSDLGRQYCKTRGWRRWFSLHTISEIKFVKFAPYRVERIGAVDRVRVTCDPTEQLPAATNPNYQYEPKPPDEIPPVPTRLLMEYFTDPSCAGTSTAILEAFPVRTTGQMTRLEKHGWGLHAGEHLSFWRITSLAAFVLVGPIAFFVYWLIVYPGDLQNASVPLGLAFGFIGTFAVLFDRGK